MLPRTPARLRRSTGFTRTDLFGVLATVFLIALLLFTVAADTGIQTRAVGCLSNLSQLSRAWLLYATDHRDYFPANMSGSQLGNWVYGTLEATMGANAKMLVDPEYSSLGPYSRDPSLYRCPADTSTIRLGAGFLPRVRSFSANQAVGTKGDGFSPVDAPWLDGSFGHTANRTWYTYGKLSDVVRPKPSGLWILIDEDEYSINDGGFGVSMRPPTQLIDWPAARHNVGAALAYADGSAEVHRWRDPRTPVKNGNLNNGTMPNNPDIVWLQDRTTTLVGGNRP